MLGDVANDVLGIKRNVQKILNSAVASSNFSASFFKYAAQQDAVENAKWTERERLLFGTALMELWFPLAKMEANGKIFATFCHFYIFCKRVVMRKGMVQLTEPTLGVLTEYGRCMPDIVSPKHSPMLVRSRLGVMPHYRPYQDCKAEPSMRFTQRLKPKFCAYRERQKQGQRKEPPRLC